MRNIIEGILPEMSQAVAKRFRRAIFAALVGTAAMSSPALAQEDTGTTGIPSAEVFMPIAKSEQESVRTIEIKTYQELKSAILSVNLSPDKKFVLDIQNSINIPEDIGESVSRTQSEVHPDANKAVSDRDVRQARYALPTIESRSGDVTITSLAGEECILYFSANNDGLLLARQGSYKLILKDIKFQRTGNESSPVGLSELTRYLITVLADELVIEGVSIYNLADSSTTEEPFWSTLGMIHFDGRNIEVEDAILYSLYGWDGLLIHANSGIIRKTLIIRSVDGLNTSNWAGVAVAMYPKAPEGGRASLVAHALTTVGFMKIVLVPYPEGNTTPIDVLMTGFIARMPDFIKSLYYLISTDSDIDGSTFTLHGVNLRNDSNEEISTYGVVWGNAPSSRISLTLSDGQSITFDVSHNPMNDESPEIVTPFLGKPMGSGALRMKANPDQKIEMDGTLYSISDFIEKLKEIGFAASQVPLQ